MVFGGAYLIVRSFNLQYILYPLIHPHSDLRQLTFLCVDIKCPYFITNLNIFNFLIPIFKLNPCIAHKATIGKVQ